jgi:hypothetical protein
MRSSDVVTIPPVLAAMATTARDVLRDGQNFRDKRKVS